MSYDISLRVKVEGLENTWVSFEDGPNITWNVSELIKQSSGWDIKNEDINGHPDDWIKLINRGIHELTNYPEKYRQYESPNGWGTIRGTLNFYHECVKMYEYGARKEDLMKVAQVYVN